MNTIKNTFRDVIILLKNGKRLYGIIDPEPVAGDYNFCPYVAAGETPRFQMINKHSILAIDADLK